MYVYIYMYMCVYRWKIRCQEKTLGWDRILKSLFIICVCIYIYMCVCIYIYIYTHYTYIHIIFLVYIHSYVCIHISRSIYIYIHTCIYTQTSASVHLCPPGSGLGTPPPPWVFKIKEIDQRPNFNKCSILLNHMCIYIYIKCLIVNLCI